MNMKHQIGVASYSEFRRVILPEGSSLFTSSLSNEGKSFIATELAISKALRLGSKKPVLLLDLNSVDRQASSILFESGSETTEKVGIVDVLLGKESRESAVYPTPVSRLYIMPYGTAPPDFEPILYLQILKKILQEVSEEYTIIIDACSVFLRNRRNFDPVEIAQIVDNVILVIQSGKTPRELVLRSKQEIESSGGVIGGIIMNDRFVKAFRSELAQQIAWVAKIPLIKYPIRYLQARLGLY